MIKIRVVQDREISRLFPLLEKFHTSTGEKPPDQKSFKKIKKALLDKKIHFVVAEEKPSFVGMCSLSISFSTYRCSPSGIIDDFFVIPRMRKKGIARQIIEKILVLAKKFGCGSVFLGCSSEDIPMYSHFGFNKIGNMMAIDC